MFMLDGGVGRSRFALMVLLGLSAGTYIAPAAAETADERLQRLENEIRELRQMLHEQRQSPNPVQAPAAVPDALPVAPARPAVTQPLGAYVRYYIQNDTLGERPPEQRTKPVVAGRISDLDTLAFDPAAYDVPNAGLFSDYRDPAAYRYVGLLLRGDLPVVEAGEYEFVVYPKPAREGGANVATRLSLNLSIDGDTALEFRDETSWQARRGRVHLEPGMRRVQLWAVAASQGFGPSPTASQLILAIKGPGDASPRPLRDLHIPATENGK